MTDYYFASNASAERQLWCGVLHRTLEDAIIGVPNHGGVSRETRLNMIERARNYFTRGSANFALVCELAGLDPAAVRERVIKLIAAAPSVEELVDAGVRGVKRETQPGKKSLYSHNGKSQTAADWSAETGIPVNTITLRIRNGWPIDRALTVPVNAPREERRAPKPDTPKQRKQRRAPTYTYNGRTLTLRQWAEETGIPLMTLRVRMQQEWPLERVLTQPHQKRAPRRRPGTPGVARDLAGVMGTGGGTSAQVRPDLDFSCET